MENCSYLVIQNKIDRDRERGFERLEDSKTCLKILGETNKVSPSLSKSFSLFGHGIPKLLYIFIP